MATISESLVNSKQRTIEQNGKTYDVVCSNYGNRIMILISDIDLQKMGTMLLVRRESKGPDSGVSFNVTTLLGKNDPEIHVFGRAIGGHILVPEIQNQSIVLGLGIQHDPDPSLIPKLLETLDQLNVWC